MKVGIIMLKFHNNTTIIATFEDFILTTYVIIDELVTVRRYYPARCFAMNMAKSRDIRGKMPSPKVIWNAY